MTAAEAEQNATTVRRLYDEGLNDGNAAVADELLAPRCLDNGQPRTSEDFKRALLGHQEAFPNWQLAIEDLIAVGDQVVVRWTGRGTYQGTYRGVAATARPVMNRGITIWRLADGKVIVRWSAADALGLLQQLGAIPALSDGAQT